MFRELWNFSNLPVMRKFHWQKKILNPISAWAEENAITAKQKRETRGNMSVKPWDDLPNIISFEIGSGKFSFVEDFLGNLSFPIHIELFRLLFEPRRNFFSCLNCQKCVQLNLIKAKYVQTLLLPLDYYRWAGGFFSSAKLLLPSEKSKSFHNEVGFSSVVFDKVFRFSLLPALSFLRFKISVYKGRCGAPGDAKLPWWGGDWRSCFVSFLPCYHFNHFPIYISAFLFTPSAYMFTSLCKLFPARFPQHFLVPPDRNLIPLRP